MSKGLRQWRRVMCGLLVLAGSAPRVRAQSQAEYRAKVQALVPIWRSVAAEQRQEDSVRARALPRDTVRVGVISVLADSGLQSLARDAAAAASGVLEARFGRSTDVLRSHRFTLRRSNAMLGSAPTVDVAELATGGKEVLSQSVAATTDAVADAWLYRGARLLAVALGPDFGRWMGSRLPVDTATAATWTGARIDLVTSSNSAARACYAGSSAACATALGLAGEDNPAANWFDAAERRQLVATAGYQLRQGHEAIFRRCKVGNDSAACDSLLQSMPVAEIQPPLPSGARQSVMRLALQLGGRDALARMLAAPDTRREQLAAAAGIPADSLAGLWRRRVLEARTSNPSITWGLAITSLIWTATCGGLALGSSRWR